MTVRDLLHRLDSAEISEWAAFFQLERERAAGATPRDPDEPFDVKAAWGAHLKGKRNG